MSKTKNKRKLTSKLLIILVIVVVLNLVLIAASAILSRLDHDLMPTEPVQTTQAQVATQATTGEVTSPESLDEQEEYEKVVRIVEDGDYVAIAQMMLDGQISRNIIDRLKGEDPKLLDYMLIDALVEYSRQGYIENFARLRLAGYITDECLYDYWEVVGAVLPDQGELNNAHANVDVLLVHELAAAYQRDDYAIRSFIEMYEAGILDEPNHQALVEKLGFDYTNDRYLQENSIGVLRELTIDEKKVYDTILECIDQGDCRSIAMSMIYGEVTEITFAKLMENDSEMMNYVISQAMGEFSEENAYENIVILRNNGFVSNQCFNIYWELMGSDQMTGETYEDSDPSVDLFLLHELEEIYLRDNEYGLEALRRIESSGLINDHIHKKLIALIGFDYTEN